MTIVARWISLGPAEASRMALEAADIDAWLADHHYIGVNWLGSNAVGFVKVVVREEDAGEANEVLYAPAMEIAGPDAPLEEEEEDESLQCPACGSEDITRAPMGLIFVGLAVIIFGMSVVLHQAMTGLVAITALGLTLALVPARRCGSCGVRFDVDIESPPPLPTPGDLEATRCPHCGSDELYLQRSPFLQLKAISLFLTFFVFAVIPLWLVMPKRRCDHCRRFTWW